MDQPRCRMSALKFLLAILGALIAGALLAALGVLVIYVQLSTESARSPWAPRS